MQDSLRRFEGGGGLQSTEDQKNNKPPPHSSHFPPLLPSSSDTLGVITIQFKPHSQSRFCKSFCKPFWNAQRFSVLSFACPELYPPINHSNALESLKCKGIKHLLLFISPAINSVFLIWQVFNTLLSFRSSKSALALANHISLFLEIARNTMQKYCK